jgi:outer membrane protein
MKILKPYICIIILFLLYNTTYAQQKITLNDAIKIALNQNTQILENENNISTYESQLKNAYGNLLPNLNIGGSWNWERVNSNGGLEVNSFGQEQYVPPAQTDSRVYNLSAGGNVILFDGLANYASINQAENNLEAARQELIKFKQDAVLQTVNLFVTIVSDLELVNYQEQDLKYNQGLMDEINQKYDLKMATLADVYSQQAQTSTSKYNLLQYKNNYEEAKISLLNYLSLDVSTNDTFDIQQVSTIDTTILNMNIDSLYQVAFSNRKDYVSQKMKLESSESGLTIAKGGLFPTLSGSYGFSTSALEPSNLFNEKDYTLGLSLNLPIFSNWSTSNNIQIAEVELENTNEDLKALERQIRSDVKSAVLDLQTAEEQLAVSRQTLKSAGESLDVQKESYRLGAVTFIDLQQTYENYVNAENIKITAEHNYLVKQYNLLSALGELNVDQ